MRKTKQQYRTAVAELIMKLNKQPKKNRFVLLELRMLLADMQGVI